MKKRYSVINGIIHARLGVLDPWQPCTKEELLTDNRLFVHFSLEQIASILLKDPDFINSCWI